MDDITLLIETIKAYKKYIDCRNDLSEQDRSDLLMIARNLDSECLERGLDVAIVL